VLRYEIKNITPPSDVLSAMEKQMRAEREKRATILNSEAFRDGAINKAEGEKQTVIKASEAKKQQAINEAEGQATAIWTIANATAESIKRVAEQIQLPGGKEAVQLRIAEQWITEFGRLARTNNTMIIPSNVADIASMIATATAIYKESATGPGSAVPPPPPPTR
jgi:regulator of protease activity HflC (stomatin/prohibitin superfamily)